jgi:KDO2-lipid IV(A) lauroyltransferase
LPVERVPQVIHPRWWPTWIGISVLWLLAQLPYRWLLGIGTLGGRLLMRVLRKRRDIAAINIGLCFPDLSLPERRALVRRHFESLGIAVLEIALSCWGTDRRLKRLVSVRGLENIEAALSQGRGVLLLNGHFTCSEIAGRLLSLCAGMRGRALYRAPDNPVLKRVLNRGRGRYLDKTIPRGDVRSVVKSLQQNKVVWYAPDQNYGLRHSVFAPLFGVPAATTTATSRLSRLSGSPVIPFLPLRLENGMGYLLRVLPPLENFPSDDVLQDTARINRVIEEHVRRVPEQYLWIHKRFKDQPDGRARVYTKSALTF